MTPGRRCHSGAPALFPGEIVLSDQLPLPRSIRTSDRSTHAVEYAADIRLLPQVIRWARTSSNLSTPEASTVAAATEALFLNAAVHAYGPIRLVLVRHSHRSAALAVMDQGPRDNSFPGHPDPRPGSSLHTLGQTLTWGWYGDHRGHTVWARLNTSHSPQERAQ